VNATRREMHKVIACCSIPSDMGIVELKPVKTDVQNEFNNGAT
jgi:hypothetical protein